MIGVTTYLEKVFDEFLTSYQMAQEERVEELLLLAKEVIEKTEFFLCWKWQFRENEQSLKRYECLKDRVETLYKFFNEGVQ